MADGAGPEYADKVRRPVSRSRLAGLRALIAKLRDPVIILPYLWYGTEEKLQVCGRVLQDAGFRPTRDAERRWRNLVAFFKRMESDEVPGARLRARYGAASVEATSNRQGYFTIELEARAEPGWNEIALELVREPRIRAVGRVLVPPRDAAFGVVSDIDDTIVYSNVLSKWRMVVGLALSNARTRKPFPGVAAFYRALHRGVNPVFYVSKSPWNLYVPLVEYLELQRLPLGPLVLRDFGWRMEKDHKTRAIDAILRTYPELPFVLSGDSGERDPEIYADVVRRYPRRIRAIYIRSVDPRPERLGAIATLSGEVARTGCQLVLAPDSEYAAAHAAGEGLIAAAALAEVRADKSADARASASPRRAPAGPP
jgi:phosphatidate phosphatase APP1